MPADRRYDVVDTPIGPLTLEAGEHGLSAVRFPGSEPTGNRDSAALTAARSQLEQYFAGERTAFDLPLRPAGAPFQLRVWEALQRIPYGETASYGEIARELGHPTAARAVGAANGRNPIAILIPCHRVVGTSGALTGYAGGVDAKGWLLALERGERSPAPSPGSTPRRTTGRRARQAA